MKQTGLLFALLLIPLMELKAQPDSSNTIQEQHVVDSLTALSGIFVTDSTNLNPYVGIGCIVPPKIDFNIFKYLSLTPLKHYVFISPYTTEGAAIDIKRGKPQVLFSGKPGSMPDFTSSGDKAFQKKYGVTFFSQGLLHSLDKDNEADYNQAIFNYLDKKYGKGWRYELRHDAIGFDAPEQQIPEIKEASFLPFQTNSAKSLDPETDTSILWYVLPTSGFALLLSLYFIIRQKRKK